MKRALLAFVLLGTTLVALAPTAEANVPTRLQLSVDPVEEPIRPLSGLKIVGGEVIYSYTGPTAASVIQPTKISLTATASPWATVSISPTTMYLMPTSGTNEVRGTFDLYITTLADAPAFEAGNIAVTASAEANGQLLPTSGDESISFQAAYLPLIDARIDQPIRKVRPEQTFEFPITVTNFGNAQTKVTIEIENVTGGLSVPVPFPMNLESKANGGKITQQTGFISVKAPAQSGYMNDPGMINVRVKGTYALDASKGSDEIVMSLLVQTTGFYAPGPEPFLMLAGVLGAALVVGKLSPRRRR